MSASVFKRWYRCNTSSYRQIGLSAYQHISATLKSNMVSARQHPRVVSEYLQEKCAKGRVISPLDSRTAAEVKQISTFGVITKGHSPGKWWLNIDLSAPTGHSVNDGIASELCSLEYTSVDRAAAQCRERGQAEAPSVHAERSLDH